MYQRYSEIDKIWHLTWFQNILLIRIKKCQNILWLYKTYHIWSMLRIFACQEFSDESGPLPPHTLSETMLHAWTYWVMTQVLLYFLYFSKRKAMTAHARYNHRFYVFIWDRTDLLLYPLIKLRWGFMSWSFVLIEFPWWCIHGLYVFVNYFYIFMMNYCIIHSALNCFNFDFMRLTFITVVNLLNKTKQKK